MKIEIEEDELRILVAGAVMHAAEADERTAPGAKQVEVVLRWGEWATSTMIFKAVEPDGERNTLGGRLTLNIDDSGVTVLRAPVQMPPPEGVVTTDPVDIPLDDDDPEERELLAMAARIVDLAMDNVKVKNLPPRGALLYALLIMVQQYQDKVGPPAPEDLVAAAADLLTMIVASIEDEYQRKHTSRNIGSIFPGKVEERYENGDTVFKMVKPQ